MGIFKPNAQNINFHIIMQLLHGFQPNFAHQLRPPNMLRGWSRNSANKSKMVDGRHLKKSKKIVISQQPLGRFRQNLAR